MNLEIPKKFKPVVDAARMAAETVFRPISRKYDTLEHDYPKELDLFAAAIDGMNDAGTALGGATSSRDAKNNSNDTVKNGGNMASVLNIMSMCYGDVGLMLTIPRQGLGNAAIAAVANDEQMKRFGKLWAAMAITEPGAGSDSAAITATAVKDGDDYILNGQKIFVTAGERADAVVVWASLDKNLGRAAIKSFVVEKGTPGMELVRLETKMGIRASDTAAISFDDCRVPASNLLGSPEIDVKKGFAGVMETFDNTRPFVAAMAVGCAEAALERTKQLLKEKINLNYTSPINNLKAVEAEILKLEADYEAARLLTLKAAWMADNRIPNSMEASISKAKAGRIGSRITLKCVELCSSLGYSESELIEKWARDSKILDIFEGTQQIQQLIIARRLLNKSSKDLK
ncbi:MAG: acyl-CoA dehydrogenase family protein [Chitinophagales bacterium]|nr:acyl-CoA dehydrogenase family protein [Chitinophagales bacterium]MCZ2394280.1 acyl-CoA dehydrogenase family protein [Chitinophagales bacterium]